MDKYEIVYENAYKSFEKQENRKRDLDTKTSYLIALTTVILGCILEFIDINSLFQKSINNAKDICLVGIAFFMYVISIILTFTVIAFYVKILINKPYANININKILEESFLKMNQEEIKMELAKRYVGFCNENTQINNKQATTFKRTTILLFITLIIVAATHIMFLFV